MNHRETKRIKAWVASLLCLLMMLLASISFAQEVPFDLGNKASTEGGVTILADVIEWRFKMENGILYKRLYNTTTGQWIGDWIPL